MTDNERKEQNVNPADDWKDTQWIEDEIDQEDALMDNERNERTVSMVYRASVTFDIVQSDPENEAYLTPDEMIQQALHNVAENVRGATEYTDFDDFKNFEAILIHDDDIEPTALNNILASIMKTDPRELVKGAIDDDRIELTCDEFDLHDWITSLPHTNSMPRRLEGPDGETFFCCTKVIPSGYTNDDGEHIIISEAQAKELEDAADKLLGHIQSFDVLLHDIAGYSC